MKPQHFVNGNTMFSDYPEGFEHALFGLGCFWGAERLFWETKGVYVTSVGYGGGHTDNPNYDQICSGTTGHAELVHMVFNPKILSYEQLLKRFFENHDPTQGNRQGNDRGTQYRSVIFTNSDAQNAEALAAKQQYNEAYEAAGKNTLTTEITPAPKYFPAENYHQQYLAKNPEGYCSIAGTGVTCN